MFSKEKLAEVIYYEREGGDTPAAPFEQADPKIQTRYNNIALSALNAIDKLNMEVVDKGTVNKGNVDRAEKTAKIEKVIKAMVCSISFFKKYDINKISPDAWKEIASKVSEI